MCRGSSARRARGRGGWRIGELDGVQVCQRIRATPEFKRINIIMWSARTQAADVKAGRSAGADGYLTKPFSPLKLNEGVSRHIG